MAEECEGIVIRSFDYKEKSKIVHLYTPQGMDSVLARDALKMNSGKIDFITTLNVVYYHKNKGALPSLKEYQLRRSFYHLNQKIKKMQVVVILIQILQNLEEDAPHHRIFPFVIEMLTQLLDVEDERIVLATFLTKMLSVFGVTPVLKKCVLCGRVPLVNFSISDGGALCNQCAASNAKNKDLLVQLQLLYYERDFEKIKTAELNVPFVLDALYRYYQEHVHMKLKPYQI